MDLNSMVRRVQFSSRQEGERELTEKILREWEPELQKLASTITVPLLDRDDILQRLRLCVWRCIEFWPGDNFKGFVMTSLSKEKINILKWANAHKRKPDLPLLPLDLIFDEDCDDNSLAVLQGDPNLLEEPYHSVETLWLFEQLEAALRQEGKIRIAEAIRMLRQGKEPSVVALLLDFENPKKMEQRISLWAKKACQELGIKAEDLL